MQFVVERTALLVAARAAAQLTGTNRKQYGKNFDRMVMKPEGGLLCCAATDATTHVNVYMPARFLDMFDPIATKSKEFAYLLKKQVRDPLIAINGGQSSQEATITQDDSVMTFPNDQELDWDEHETGPSELFASMRIDVLARALYLMDDFAAHSTEKRFYGANLETRPDGLELLRFCATNGYCMGVADLTSNVYQMGEPTEVSIEYPAIKVLLTCLDLWREADPNEVDCEIRIVRRPVVQEDGEVWERDPIVWFDISGCGYRAIVSTKQQSKFVNYRQVLCKPDRQGITFTTAAEQVNQLAQLAARVGPKDKGKVGFRFFYSDPQLGVAMRVGVAVATPEDKTQALPADQPYTVEHHQLDGNLFVDGGGLEIPPAVETGYSAGPVEPHDPEDYKVVAIAAEYLAAMTKHLKGPVLIKFHGAASEVEVMPAEPTPDRVYCLGMPVFDGFDKEEL